MTAAADMVVQELQPYARRLGVTECYCDFNTGKVTFKVGAETFEFIGMGHARTALRLADVLYGQKLMRALVCPA